MAFRPFRLQNMGRLSADADFEEDELYLTLLNTPPKLPLPSTTLPTLPPTHFLSIVRSPNVGSSTLGATSVRGVDTSTVAAADFDVDSKTGFMPPKIPIGRLTGDLEVWERMRDAAVANDEPLTLGVYATRPQQKRSARWRKTVDSVSSNATMGVFSAVF